MQKNRRNTDVLIYTTLDILLQKSTLHYGGERSLLNHLFCKAMFETKLVKLKPKCTPEMWLSKVTKPKFLLVDYDERCVIEEKLTQSFALLLGQGTVEPLEVDNS